MRSTVSRWRRPRISSQSRHSARTVRTKRSAQAFACGARIGVWMTSIPSPRKTSSKAPLNLLSWSWIRNRIRSKMPVKLRLRACWVTQAPVGLVVQPAMWTAAFEFDEEEHVEAAERDRLDGEEIAGEHAGGLQAEELAPAWARAPWRGPKTVGEQDAPDRARGHSQAELVQLAGDPRAAPGWVSAAGRGAG